MIRIVTDSAADLTAEELSVPGIFVVPLSVTFADGTTQLDDGTMTKDEFFVRLAEDSKLPRTSQPSPASWRGGIFKETGRPSFPLSAL